MPATVAKLAVIETPPAVPPRDTPPASEPPAVLSPASRLARARTFATRHWGKGLLLLALVAAAVLAGPRLLLGPQVPVERVIQKDFVQSVVASGRVETPHRVELGVQITGTVLAVPVIEGETVAKGTPLIELEASELRAAAVQAGRAVEQARARLRQMREVQAPGAEQNLREATVTHDVAARALTRGRELLSQGFIGQAGLDELLRAERVAQAQAATAGQLLASARPSGSDSAVAEAALAGAQSALGAAEARLGYASINAPVAGTLISRNVEPGTSVAPGKILMVLSPSGDTELVVQIDERNLHLLELNQAALASADAYPNERFAAELVYVNPGVDAQRGAVEVKLRVPKPPEYLKQDMTVSVDIETARRNHAVLVPVTALHDADGAAPWVLKVDGRHARRANVQLGLRSNGVAEVLQGLRAGDELIPAANLAVMDGARLRAVAPSRIPGAAP